METGLLVAELYPDKELDQALAKALLDGVISLEEYESALFFWLS